MKPNLKIFPLLLLALFGIPDAAHAHLISGNGLASGITHPLLGLDHLLAMVAVGIISTQIGGKAVWKVPVTFVSFMVIGGLLAIGGLTLPFSESGVALSILFFGIIIALAKKIPINWAVVSVALFAIFHGHTHGEEMPLIANPTLYATGFVLSTTVLHIMGVFMGRYSYKTPLTLKLLRSAGAAMSFAGFLFLFSL